MDDTPTTKALETFLESRDWRVEKAGESAMYRLTLPAGADQLVGYALLHAADFMFYPVAPLPISPKRFPAVAEYALRINNQLWTHNFELDYQTGLVRCKASFAFRDISFDIQLVENAIHNTVDAMLHYLPGLAAVAAGTQSAAEAAAERIAAQSASPPENGKAQALYKIVNQFFEGEGWEYQQHDDALSRIIYSGQNRDSYFVYVTMLAAVKKFFVSVGIKGVTETKKVTAVSEWITRMNYNLRLGYFNYDFAQNHLSFVNGIDFYGTTPTPALLRNVVYPALTTADKYWPYLNDLITGTRTLQEAVPAEMQQLN